ncbi:hypothetical protein G195_006204, partial [Phytophthora kernoviae 00238/432]
FLVIYGLIGSSLRMFQYYHAVNLSQWCWILAEGFTLVGCSYVITLSKPLKELKDTRPTSSLIGPSTLISIFGQEAINIISLSCGIHMLSSQVWYCPFSPDNVDAAKWWLMADNHMATTIFFTVIFQQHTAAWTYSFGSIYRQPIWRNYLLIVFFMVLAVLDMYLLLGEPSAITDQFRISSSTNVVGLPDVPMPMSFRVKYLGIILGNVFGSILFEYFVVLGPVRTYFRNKYHTDMIPMRNTYKPDIEAVKKLRAESQAPLKDVRNALAATNGDFPAAFEWLRKKGIASASKKAGRATAEGLVGVSVAQDGLQAAMVEINSETDFVAMNDKFQALVSNVATAVASSEASGVVTQLPTDQLALVDVDGATVAQKVPELVGVVGENVVAQRAVQFQLEEGTICSYLHNVAAPGLGRAGALVALQYPSKSATPEQVAGVKELGHRLAMHIVAAKPRFLSREVVPEELVEKERAFLADQVKDSGKPAHIVAKMTEGRLGKFFGEITLLEQDHFIEEGNPKVGKFVEEQAKNLGLDVKVAAYERFGVGEGKEEEA